MSEPILLQREGAVARLRFNRPPSLNAIDAAMAQRLLEIVEALAVDATVRAVVLSGEGRGFMAGGDVAAMAANPEAIGSKIIDPLHTALKRLAQIDAPVIAAVHGVVAGAGVSLLLAADVALAAAGTRFSLAYLGIGASCDGGASFALPRVVGLRHALAIAVLGETFDAAAAKDLGLVNRVVPPESLETETMQLAQRLAAGPTRAIGHMRRLMRRSFESDYASQLEAEKAAFIAGTQTHDFTEGVTAFLGKRSARFTGS